MVQVSLWVECDYTIAFSGSVFTFFCMDQPCLFSFFSSTNFAEKKCRRWWDSNSYLQSKRQARLPLDHHHDPHFLGEAFSPELKRHQPWNLWPLLTSEAIHLQSRAAVFWYGRWGSVNRAKKLKFKSFKIGQAWAGSTYLPWDQCDQMLESKVAENGKSCLKLIHNIF